MPAHLEINQVAVPAPLGRTLFELADEAGVRVPTSCHRQGKCRECLVEVVEGMERLSPPAPQEGHLTGRFRLSCRTAVAAPDGAIRCHTLRRGAMRVEERGEASGPCELDPAVVRDGDRILLDGHEIARGAGPLHGIAVDLGTTTVVMRLLDLETGAAVATAAFENPQRFGGSDVMARIQFDTEHKGRLLQRTLAGYMAHEIEAFPVDPATIYEVAIAGNSTMRDLFFGLPVHSIGQKPYRSVTEHELREGRRTTTSLEEKARRLHLPVHPRARAYGLPLISGHVGADAAACLLAIDLAGERRAVALMDIGTNTELLLGVPGRVLAASCPAGPAFEGGAVQCGMPGLEGAIERVRLRPDGSAEAAVIGDAPPEGICGSGLVDLLSELLRTGRMDPLGRLANGADRFVVDPGRGIALTEGDISELAQAKGANVAGLQAVVDVLGIPFDALDVFYLAGGFARHLSVEAARRIGLVPNLPDSRFRQIGNASVEGAAQALLSVRKRRALEASVRSVEHVELETHPRFFDFFVEGCQFVPVETPARTP